MTYFIYVNGKSVPVSKEVYREYWRLTNRENYLKRLDIRYNVCPFSDYSDVRLTPLLVDDSMDIEKVIETKEILKLLYEALLTLDNVEFELVNDLFFRDKTLNEISQSANVSISTVARRRDKILKYLKNILQ